ncbi:MAG: serine hydrolase [Flavobacteriales bacterium]|nr:serine hydrolase [Flavobacteriales bacterium]
MKIKWLFFGFLISLLFSFQTEEKKLKPPFLSIETPWADSVFKSMTIDQKIGQLFSVAAYSNKDDKHKQEIIELIKKYHIGGLTFFQGGPVRQAKLTNAYQAASSIPLMIAIDGEWGLSMRLDSTVRYPWQMTLGAIQNDSLIYQMGIEIAEQFRRLGVHVNFAPVVDVNNNPKNPIINARSFGEDKRNVTRKGLAYMRGMQNGGILANAKHFPGHGDTDTDSHISLPVVKHSKERIDSIELFPFKHLINQGVSSMMTAHLYLPSFVGNNKKASSLNKQIVDSLLKQKLGFQGLIFTDGLNMGGVARYQASEKNDLDALLAGNDVLLLSQDIEKAFVAIKTALDSNVLSQETIDASCLKILKAKEWLKLHQEKPIKIKNLYEDLNQNKYEYTIRRLTEASLTVVRNKDIIPIRELKDQKIISLAFAEEGVSYRSFQESLNLYSQVDTLHYINLPVSEQKKLLDTLLNYDHIIVSIHKSNANPWKSFKIDTEIKNFLNVLRLKKPIIIDVFANAYSLQEFLAAEFSDGLIMSYQNSKNAQELSAQLIFGGIKANGKLPISASSQIIAGMGEEIAESIRLKYTMPEELGIKSEDLYLIDQIVQEGIQAKAYPGAQVYVAKAGKVIYNKSFGNLTYEDKNGVKPTDLYDLASVTKITSTLLALMELDGEGKISLDDKLGKHLKMTKGTPYAELILRDILAHQAGLAAWIPFYNKTLTKGQPRFDIYSTEQSDKYSVEVAKDFYMIKEYQDTIFYRIINRAEIDPSKGYKYSDIGYYFLKEIIEGMVKKPIDEYNRENFYESLGMSRTTFNPLHKFDLSAIAPTENDKTFRKQQIHGYVHDPGAAMLGGVGGHAGLFSNANDMGKLLQMYLQDGTYANKKYIKHGVIEEYAKCQFCKDSVPNNKTENRRGAGFDKPQFHGNPGPTCECVPMNSYGHSGFTGTYTWVDPENKLVYVFLSNRVYQDANNKKLLNMDIRTRIQEKIYEAISNKKYRTEQSALNLH